MKKMLQKVSLPAILWLSALVTNSVLAQITITATDLLSIRGNQETILLEEEGNYNFDSGSAGGNQVWDFRARNFITPIPTVLRFYSPQGTPEANVFPDANLVQEILPPDTIDGSFYNFYNITTNYALNLGDSFYVSLGGFDTSFVTVSNDTIAGLPLQFGDTWLTASADTTVTIPGLYYVVDADTATNTIDAWGTVRLPMGDFECLRMRVDSKSTQTTVANGIIVQSNSISNIEYRWWTKGLWEVAYVESQPGETDPNFTDAWGWGRLDAVMPITAVSEAVELPQEFNLLQNYPNPFNPETTIAFELAKNERVQLDIYTLLGQKIQTLINSELAAGHHKMTWDATNFNGDKVAAGLYIYRLMSGSATQSKKMLLLH
ncbi:MAG: T9SS C-terminal target domain-containing protein [Calditrichaeota bacterium]|nr:MAG: T9SS C-terminal target domain-containing protein [Calditrichota bacterium]